MCTHKPVDRFPVLLGLHLGHVGPLFGVERNDPTEAQVFSMWTPASQPAGRVGGSAPCCPVTFGSGCPGG